MTKTDGDISNLYNKYVQHKLYFLAKRMSRQTYVQTYSQLMVSLR